MKDKVEDSMYCEEVPVDYSKRSMCSIFDDILNISKSRDVSKIPRLLKELKHSMWRMRKEVESPSSYLKVQKKTVELVEQYEKRIKELKKEYKELKEKVDKLKN